MADLGHLAAAHHIEMRHALALTRARVDQLHARLDCAREHLDKRDATLGRIVQGLEDKDHGAIVLGRNLKGVAIDKRHLAVIGRRREVRGDIVHQGIDALLFDTASHKNGDEKTLCDGTRKQALDLFLRKGLALEILFHQVVVGLGNELAQRLVRGLGLSTILLGNLALRLLGSVAMACLHAHQVDHAAKVLTLAPGKGYGTQARTKTLAQQTQAGLEIGIFLIDSIDKNGARQAQILCRIPQLDGRRLRARRSIDNKQRRFAYAHRGVGIANKIGIAGRIQYVDA